LCHGKPTVCEGAWISYLTGAENKNFVLSGKLTAGYGSMWGQNSTKPDNNIGPEFTFGLTMDAALDEPVLIVKAAWGGKSLHTDFRPPSAGPYVMPQETLLIWDQHPQGAYGIPKAEDRAKLHAEKVAFRQTMAAPASLPEFKGNVVAVQTAPFWSTELGAIAEKRDSLSQMRYFLNSKHKDHANADGHMTKQQKEEYLRKFEADLISTAEAALWKRGASNAGYHYLGCAKTFALMGKAFAEATLSMQMKSIPRTTSGLLMRFPSG
jgi:hypothetical protein